MKLKYTSILFVFFCFPVFGQFQWSWTPLANIPIRTSNNAVASFNSLTGQSYVYSFGGIDSTKTSAGIHQRVFVLNFMSNLWSELAPLPDTLGKIAMGASYVNGKIYIMGGYHVLPNGNEISSNKVHVFNPLNNTFETDAATIPVPIDDHVQCVYKDSLIYVVTGWSQTTNKPDVQIFNPSLNQWAVGTSVPNTNVYKAFGASGYIVGDTLYYFGGVTSGVNFVAQSYMRKGYINPNNPSDITWSTMIPAPGGAGYRTACSAAGQTIFWLGGSSIAYNYDGIAYNGSGGVQPQNRILHLNSPLNTYQNNDAEPFGVMDLRGIGELNAGRWVVCGGMDSNQVVSNRTFLLQNQSLALEELISTNPLQISYHQSGITVSTKFPQKIELTGIDGQKFATHTGENDWFISNDDFSNGVYLIRSGNYVQKIIIQ